MPGPVTRASVARGVTPLSRTLCGGLTTVRQPFAEVGRAAVEGLIALVEGAAPAECSRRIPTQLVIRASSAAPRGAWEAK